MMTIVEFEVASGGRSRLFEALRPLLVEAREFAGNVTYRAFADSENDAHFGLMQEWRTLDHFRVYASSDLFARLSEILRPTMVTAPVSRRFNTTNIAEVRG